MIELFAVVSSLVVSSAALGAPGGYDQPDGGVADRGGACVPAWIPEFGGRPGVDNNYVFALAVFDDGNGPALYAGGSFTSAAGVAANDIARWDGQKWTPLGSGANNTVLALAVYDDGLGGGPALYAAGYFTNIGGVAANRIAKWNGSTWSPLGSGMTSFEAVVRSLCVYDDPTAGKPVLVAGGWFTTAGGVSANRVAKWNGSTWSPFGQGLNEVVLTVTTYDDGSGAGRALYVGGAFTIAGGNPANRIARWDGASWSSVGGGVVGGGNVQSLAEWDDGSGSQASLVAGGLFTNMGGVPANRIAKWNGATWSALGQGLGGGVQTILPGGGRTDAGPLLHVGGSFTSAGGQPAIRIARWNGTSWVALGDGLYGGDDLACRALAEFDDGSGSGPCLHAGGRFLNAGTVSANGLAKWDGTAWRTLGSGVSDQVRAMAVFDDGSGDGPQLFVGGSFTTAGSQSISRIAKWKSGTWEPLGSGLTGGWQAYTVLTMIAFDHPTVGGPALIVGGDFDFAGGVPVTYIAKWDGKTWSPLGEKIEGWPRDFEIFDDGLGGGPALYVSGISSADGVPMTVGRWNGTEWVAIATTAIGGGDTMTVFDDGSGAALYVGGGFTVAGVSEHRVGRWDGRTWSVLGPSLGSTITDLEVFDDGNGPALYACGAFSVVGGVLVNKIVKWTGTEWVGVGGGVSAGLLSTVLYSMVAHDDGDGPSLFVGGRLGLAGATPALNMARWDGTAWHPVGPGLPATVHELVAYDVGAPQGAQLLAAGEFMHSSSEDSFIARWGGCSTMVGDIDGDGDVDGDDLVVVLGQWGACTLCPGDLNRDGIVNGVDLGIVLGSWAP